MALRLRPGNGESVKGTGLFRCIALLLLLCFVCPAFAGTVTDSISSEDLSSLSPAVTGGAGVSAVPVSTEEIETEIFKLVNEARNNETRRSYPLLRRVGRLDRLAERHSSNMARKNTLFHAMPSGVWGQNVAIMGPGTLRFARCKGSGPRIHQVRNTPAAIANATMDLFLHHDCKSGWGHRGNILTGRYRTIGIGVAYARGVYWITQDFGY